MRTMTVATQDEAMTGGLDLELAGTRLRLLACRAIWWPQAGTLFVADVHLGKAETFQALGVPVPSGATAATLRRLGAVTDATGVRRLVVLGDLLHARRALEPATMGPLRAWRQERAGLEVLLVRGNHDDRAGDPPADLDIESIDAPSPLGPFSLCHEPAGDAPLPAAGGYRLAGHVHPAVRLRGRGGDSVRVPCFSVGATEAVLPAFGDFTGGFIVGRSPSQRLFAVAGERVFALPGPG